MLGIVGQGSKIAEEFVALCGEPWKGLRLSSDASECDRFLVCTGLLVGLPLRAMLPDRIAETFARNFSDVAEWCDAVLATNPRARIVVIGSESGFSGGYDMAYAGAKAALHLYVETKKLSPNQQLVAIAPGIIEDAGMTLRRIDHDTLVLKKAAHPMGRFCTSREVASLAEWLLGPDGGYVSGTVIRMNGGDRR